MTIKREVNGQMMEFELTERELRDAYFEQEHNFDMEDVRNFDVPCPEEYVSKVASLARNYMDTNDCMAEDRWNCIELAIKEVCEDA